MSRRSLPLPSYLSRAEPAHVLTLVQAVAFRDCDPMGVLWHGNYLAYAEVARNALGDRLACGIACLRALDLFAPVVRSQVLHLAPVRPADALTIVVELYPTRQPRRARWRASATSSVRLPATGAKPPPRRSACRRASVHCPFACTRYGGVRRRLPGGPKR